MLIALISDVHSNLQALRRVMEEIDASGADEVFCLGDIVGYGADPGPCIELIRSRCSAIVLGNHDLAVSREIGIEVLPPDGQEAAKHNRSALSDEQLAYLAGLPMIITRNETTLAHASPGHPERWLRLGNYQIIHAQFDHFSTAVCFLGHTHSPAVISQSIGVSRVRKGHRFLINVGSVGQPRDGDPRACLALFDTETFSYELRRIPYDIEAAQARIREEGLPEHLAHRLLFGR